MRLVRNIRARVLKRTGRKPTSTVEKTEKGFAAIKATEKEKMMVREMVVKAIQRRLQRETLGKGQSLSNDAQILALNKEASDLLGKKRAKKFFEICNDPYA